MDYKETIKERIKILPEQLRTFIVNESWRREAEKIGQQFNIGEEKYPLFENEVFLVLLCFEPKNDLAENIKRELAMDSNTADIITEEVRGSIFKQVSDEINSMWQVESTESAGDTERSESTEEKNSGVGNSFEQIILNQAKAMRPAFTSQELGPSVAKPAVPPENLPVEEQKAIHNYIGESDPYREPTE